MKTYLNLSIVVESDEPLDSLQEAIQADLEFQMEHWKLGVLSMCYDKEMARQLNNQLLSQVKQSIDLQREQAKEEGQQVTAVLDRLNLVLPRSKYGHAVWRVPNGQCFGETRGLSNFRGELVLTNGVTGILVIGYANERAKWVQIHFDNFIPDKVETLPIGLVPRPRQPKLDQKLIDCLAEF